jgi:prephenate dehydrogenase
MRIAIMGLGRMGSWLAGVLAGAHETAVYDTQREKCEGIPGAERLAGPSDLAGFKPGLLINTVSLEETVRCFQQSEPYLAQSCILCDMASIKQGVEDYYRSSGFRFVSIHPMFGPTFADMGALKEESAVIITESDREGAEFFRRFFDKMGVNTVEYSFIEHDRMMAYSLTIPFVSSFAFAACIDAKAVPGTTFKKHKGIAEGLLMEDDRLLSEILFNPYSLVEIDRITQRLEFLKHIIKGRDYEEARLFFERLRKNIM